MTQANAANDSSGASNLPDLVQRFRSGEEQVIGEILQICDPVIMGVLRPMLKDDHAVADVYQDCNCQITKSLRGGGYREWECFKGWIAAVARTKALDYLRKRRRVEPGFVGSGQDADSGKESVDRQAARPERITLVRRGLGQLDETHRKVVILRMDGMSHEEISQTLELAVGTVRNIHSRALKILRGDIDMQKAAAGWTSTSEG